MDSESYLKVDDFGNKIWRNKDGILHRIDGPAVEYINGDKEWYQNGKLHREDGPAKEYINGDKEWYQNGKLHREDGPAKEYINGRKVWCQNDLYHRVDGPAVIARYNFKQWYLNGYNLKNKQDFFESLSEEDKKIALFSMDFLNN